MPTDEEVVQTAAEAAEGLLFSRVKNSSVKDVDVTVTFEDDILEVDVYLNAPEADANEQQLAEEAAQVAQNAVDELFAAES